MSQILTCPRRGHSNFGANAFCSACGVMLAPPSGVGHGWKLLLGIIALLAGVLWAAAIFNQGPTQPNVSQLQSLAAGGASPSPTAQTVGLTSTQHLAEARGALADDYRPNKDPKKASWGEVATARWRLKAISPGAPEYREAQELLKEVARRERQIGLAKRSAAAEATPTPEAAATAGGAAGGEVETESRPTSTAKTQPLPPATPHTDPSATSYPRPATTDSGSTSSSDYYRNWMECRCAGPSAAAACPRERPRSAVTAPTASASTGAGRARITGAWRGGFSGVGCAAGWLKRDTEG